jgi:outer membrane protein OmpA-like peptidoglycan-associated protein
MTTTIPRSRGRTVLGAAGVALAGAGFVSLLISVDGQMSGGGPGGECRQLLAEGPAKGPRSVIVLDRTGRLASAQIPGRVVDALVRTAQDDDPEKLGSVSLLTVGGGAGDTHLLADNAALMDPTAGTARQGRIAEGLPACLRTLASEAPAPSRTGSDVLYALQRGARLAQSAREAGSEDVRLYVVTDGEANHGLLDLRRQGYPDAHPASVVRRVVDDGNVPDLAGLDVELIGLGQELPEAERGWLEDFYLGVCEAGGGTCTVSSETVPTDAADDGEQVPEDAPLSVLRSVPDAPAGTVAVDPAAFVPDSTDLVDPAQVAAALRPLSRDLASGRVAGADVVGHACDDGSPRDGLVTLSLARAEAIKGLLVGKDQALSSAVTATGVGADHPVAVPAGSTEDERCAAQRTVVITPR